MRTKAQTNIAVKTNNLVKKTFPKWMRGYYFLTIITVLALSFVLLNISHHKKEVETLINRHNFWLSVLEKNDEMLECAEDIDSAVHKAMLGANFSQANSVTHQSYQQILSILERCGIDLIKKFDVNERKNAWMNILKIKNSSYHLYIGAKNILELIEKNKPITKTDLSTFTSQNLKSIKKANNYLNKLIRYQGDQTSKKLIDFTEKSIRYRVTVLIFITFSVILLLFYNRKLAKRAIAEEEEKNIHAKLLELNREKLTRAQLLAGLGIWELDVKNNKIYWSDETFKIFGRSKEKGQPSYREFLHYVHRDDRRRIQKFILGNMMKGGSSYHHIFRIVTESGDNRFAQGAFETIVDDQGNVICYTGTLVDVTSKKKIEEALDSMNKALETSVKRAEAANRAKSIFLANMSHEIRTPMNAIIGMSSILQETPLQSDQKEFVEIIYNSSKSLLMLLNDMLDFSKIESGKVILEKTNFNLKELTTDIVKLFKPITDAKNLKLSYHYDKSLPSDFIGDSNRIHQVLTNLISNAVKFTKSGEVKLDFKCIETYGVHILIRVSVKDTGIGISKERQTLIFESFTQEDVSTTREFGGTGLGLTISKQLIELMGGTLELESEKGKGSHFWFEISIEKAKAETIDNSTQLENFKKDYENLSKLKLLVAEDNKVNQKIVLHMLKTLSCEIDIVENGKIALDKIKTQHYDIVLMDCQMPEMDGYEATQAIREYEEPLGKHVIIIAMTANAIEGDREKCIQFGMDDYISKPVEKDRLLGVIYSWIKKEKKIKNISEEINMNDLLESVDQDLDFTKEIIQEFLKSAIVIIEKLDKAVEERNVNDIKFCAHTLKGSSRSVCAPSISDICNQIEQETIKENYLQLAILKQNLRDHFYNLKEDFDIFLNEGAA